MRRWASRGVTETVTVTAESRIIDKDVGGDHQRRSRTIRSGACRSGTQYRDLINLIPGVQYTQDQVRGPSAGGSGQDNVYNFDGVNVTLPLFGTLSAEPASHDIAQITVVKGGAQGDRLQPRRRFRLDSVSKSGTSTFHGLAGYRFQTAGMSARAEQRQRRRATTRIAAGPTSTSAGPILPGSPVLLRLVLPSDGHPQQRVDRLRPAAATTTAPATRASAS